METADPNFIWVRDLIEALDPNHWRYKFLPDQEQPYDFTKALVQRFLAFLHITSVKREDEGEWVWIHYLGDPESNVLKLKERKNG